MRALGESVFDARLFEDDSPLCVEAESGITSDRLPSGKRIVDFIVLIVTPSPNTLGENRGSWETALQEGIFRLFPVGSLVRIQIMSEEIPMVDMEVKEPVTAKAE